MLGKYFYNLFCDSDRSGHLTAVITLGVATAVLGVHLQEPLLVLMGVTCPWFEVLASPDMDHDSIKINRKRRNSIRRRLWLSYWSLYRWIVPHRSPLSHSLLFGTPLRFAHLMLPVVLPVALIAIARSPETSLDIIRWAQSNPIEALGWASQWDWIFYSALLSDAVHLAKDKFWPWQWVMGR